MTRAGRGRRSGGSAPPSDARGPLLLGVAALAATLLSPLAAVVLALTAAWMSWQVARARPEDRTARATLAVAVAAVLVSSGVSIWLMA